MQIPRAHIACLDLDTFFVSVERLLDPSLVGQPVVVGGRKGSRGVVTSASYEVRKLGVRSGMPMAEAVRRAPDAVFVPTRHDAYAPYTARVRGVLERYCPVVRTASIDEFFLDFSGCDRLYERPGETGDQTFTRVAQQMREAIQREHGLPASVGIGATRAVAKMASGRAKPAGVWMVSAGQERAFVHDMPVRRFPGIGPVAEERLTACGIATLGALLAVPDTDPRIGGYATSLRRGLDVGPLATRDRPAFQEHDSHEGAPEGSLSNERTFFADVDQREVAEVALRALAERVTWRLRKRGARARTVTLKLRYADFTTLTRGVTLPATDAEADVVAAVFGLLRAAWTRRLRVRLLGVQLSNLVAADPQLPLFPAARPRAGAAIDAVRARFGYEAIRLGAARRESG